MEIAAEDTELETELLRVLLEEVERIDEELIGGTMGLLKVVDFAERDMLVVVEYDEVALDVDIMLLLKAVIRDEEVVLDTAVDNTDDPIEDDILLSNALVCEENAVLLPVLIDCNADELDKDEIDERPTVDERSVVVEGILDIKLEMEERVELASIEAVDTT
jgi:hypothetical protein